jgi:hypothetical protein
MIIRVSRLFVLCISLVFGGKYMEFRIIFSFQYSISINTFEVDPPSDSLNNAVVKPKNRLSYCRILCIIGRFPFNGLTGQTRIFVSVSVERSARCFSNI